MHRAHDSRTGTPRPERRWPARLAGPAGLLAALVACAALLVAVDTTPAVQKSESEQQLEFGARVARMGSWREAAFRFERAVSADAENARAWNNLGVARENLGELEGAKQAYERALDLVPDDRRIRMNYERFLNNYKTRHAPAADPATSTGEEPANPAGPSAPTDPEGP